MFRNALFVTLVLAVAVGCSSKKDEPVVVPPSFGPSAIAGGDDALLMVSGDMQNWTQVLQATSTIQTDADIQKIVKVPGHASNRLVAICDNPTVNENDLIYYNDNGGTGAWTKAWFGTSVTDFSYLDAAHRPLGVQDEWTLNDIFFVNSTTGYAVGSDYVILWTYDAGATWRDLNAYQGLNPTVIDFQEIDLSIAVPAEFIAGATVTNGALHTGRIISVDEYYDRITVDVVHATAFTSGDTVQVGTGTPVTCTVNDDYIWKISASDINAVWGTTTTLGVHTVRFGLYSYLDSNGVWYAVSNAPATPDVRTFEFFGAPVNGQGETGEIGDYSVNGLFFFDATTGVAGTDDGVWYTTTNGATWTQFTVTDTDSYHFFTYSQDNLTSNGFLYSLNDSLSDNDPGRVAVTYAAGVWTIETTTGWVQHGTAVNVDMWYVDGAYSIFTANGKIFVADDSSTNGTYGFCSDPNNATFNSTFWTDTTQANLGGTLANGSNPAYDKGVLDATTAPSGWINTICKR